MSRTGAASPRDRAQIILTIALAAGVLLALASVAGSGAAAPAQPETVEPAAASSQVETTLPLATPTPLVLREAPSTGVLLKQYLDERYGPNGTGAAWHANVRGVAMRLGTAVVQTDLADGPVVSQHAAAIAEAVLGFRTTTWGRHMSGVAVEVYGQGGRLLIQDRVVPTATSGSVPTIGP